jgi:hypothetical protein
MENDPRQARKLLEWLQTAIEKGITPKPIGLEEEIINSFLESYGLKICDLQYIGEMYITTKQMSEESE